jgi:hypothetical protein
MVITDANEFVAEVHDRMPVILEAHQFPYGGRPSNRLHGDTKLRSIVRVGIARHSSATVVPWKK